MATAKKTLELGIWSLAWR